MSTVRLAITNELDEIFSTLEKAFKPLSRAEILKLALSDLYSKVTKKKEYTIDYSTPTEKEMMLIARDAFELDDESQDIYGPEDGEPFSL